jgi:arsenical pump membrane protein
VLGAVGAMAALVCLVLDRGQARSAASQVWPAFVLVAGLLLIGLAAEQDGLFAAAGRRMAARASSGLAFFGAATMAIAVVTAVLNLDTSVVFLTPVFVYAGTRRGSGGTAVVVACLLLSNAGSLLLPGSNLTNLIVLGHLHLAGGRFLAHMALPWTASVVITAAVIAVAERRGLGGGAAPPYPGTVGTDAAKGLVILGIGAVAVVAATVLVVVLRSPALPIAGVGLAATALRVIGRRTRMEEVGTVLGLPVLIGLFGIATALGTLGRWWSGPATLLGHLDPVGTAVLAAGASVLFNNLPAASLLAARVPPHPYSLLIGLDVGPNLFVTGSLAWILWWRTVRASGGRAPTGRAVILGLIAVPLAMAAALAMLAVTGSS